MILSAPRLVIAGLSGDGGKTLVALGLARAFAQRAASVAAFKKGPDYIDAAWLGFAAGTAGRNLDTFLMDDEALGTALSRSLPADLLVVEGNRGLFDGLDAAGSHSTATLAKRLRAPVILVVDVTKRTRTTAALVLGCVALDPEVRIAGVVLNRVATERQERVIREAIERAGLPPVVGAIPRLAGKDPLPGRHLGLVTAVEHPERERAVRRAAEAVVEGCDLEALRTAAATAPAVMLPHRNLHDPGTDVRVGWFRDPAFSFYYPENLEALREAGAEMVPISPRHDPGLPEIDALYLGGGFPEVHAEALSSNAEFRAGVADAVRRGLPVYAECGGLMYLAREVRVEGRTHEMAGVLDLVVEHTARPQGHGYVEATVLRDNPYHAAGTILRGHEFHYSRVTRLGEESVLRLDRGRGLGDGMDGICSGRVWASYTHLHALGTPSWAPAVTSLARAYRGERNGASAAWA